MLLRAHIWRRSKLYKKQYCHVGITLKNAKQYDFLKNVKVVFTWLLDGASCIPNAMSLFPGLIAVNAEWAARLVLIGDDEVKRAFRFTMGHEMTHQSGDYMFLEAFTRDRKFVNWVNEVHADYGGAMLAFDGNINDALSAVRYKAKDFLKDKDYQTHPSWKRREDYLKVGAFDIDLIKGIANEVRCSNNALIDKVCKHFEPIVLKED